MASEGPVKALCDALTCPTCLDYFRIPVMLDCGHNFCKVCILQYWMGPHKLSTCPKCKKPFRHARSNWQLGNIVPLVKKLQEGKRAERKRDVVCEKHQKPLKFFCKEDQAPLCAMCKRTKAHGTHAVVLVDEAARELKEKTKAQLTSMEEERKKLVSQKKPQDPGSLD